MMIPEIFDRPEEKGIDIVFDLQNGLAICVFMTDEGAQEMVDIIQNKLNSRLP